MQFLMHNVPYEMIVAAVRALFTVLFGCGVYLAFRLHRKFYMRRSDLRLIGDCYTPDQIRAAFRKTFAAPMGSKTTAACNMFLVNLAAERDN